MDTPENQQKSPDLITIACDSNGLIRQAEREGLAVDEDVTPDESFFIVHHYDAPPEISRSEWRLSITGRVERPITLDWEGLANFQRTSVRCVLECSGNSRRFLVPRPPGTPFRNGVLGQADWSGVSLASVLREAGLKDDAVSVVVRGPDGNADHSFAKGLPLDKALDPDTLLATEINGKQLSHLRGGPVRLVVPGWLGVWSVKWVNRIEVWDRPFDGYWQTARYVYLWPDDRRPTPVTNLPVKSLVAQPSEGELLKAGTIRISGYAWSGNGRITSVVVRIGDGDWLEAKLTPPESRWAWYRWEHEWKDAKPGRYAIASQATDETGQRQPEQADWNELGYANNAVQPIVVDVVP